MAVSYSKPALVADLKAIHVSKIRLIQGLAYFYFQVTKCTFNNYGPSGTVENKDGLCVLAINIINEKIYIFLWFWFLTLCVWTGVHLFIRILSMALINFRYVIFGIFFLKYYELYGLFDPLRLVWSSSVYQNFIHGYCEFQVIYFNFF